MYRVLKSTGYNANVVIENTDTKANVIIGKATMEVINTIKEAGYSIPAPQESWDTEVNKECAIALTSMTMKMKKPIRDQRNPETKKQANKQIDAMDVMLGLANYSK